MPKAKPKVKAGAGQKSEKVQQSKLVVLMNEAKKMKLSYGTTISQATTVMSSLQNDESWRVLAGLPECQELKDQQGQISETMKMNTSMDGGSVFLRVKTEAGRQSVFDIVSKIETDLKAGFVDKASIGEMNAAVDHIAVQRSMAGAQINKGEIQLSAIERRIVLMTEKVSGMEDADLSKLVTELQSKMTSRDAAQQSFVKMGQQSLFDFIR